MRQASQCQQRVPLIPRQEERKRQAQPPRAVTLDDGIGSGRVFTFEKLVGAPAGPTLPAGRPPRVQEFWPTTSPFGRAIATAPTFAVVRAAFLLPAPWWPDVFCGTIVSMKRRTVVPKKRRGPAPTGKGTPIQVRVQPPELSA